MMKTLLLLIASFCLMVDTPAQAGSRISKQKDQEQKPEVAKKPKKVEKKKSASAVSASSAKSSESDIKKHRKEIKKGMKKHLRLIESANREEAERAVQKVLDEIRLQENVYPGLQSLSIQLLQRLKYSGRRPAPSHKESSDPSYSVQDAFKDGLAAAVLADEEALKAEDRADSLSWSDLDSLETDWKKRQRLAFNVVLKKLGQGKILRSTRSVILEDWLRDPSLQLGAIEKSVEFYANQERREQELAERTKAAKALRVSVPELDSLNLKEVENKLLMRLAEIQKVDLFVDPPSARAQALYSMSFDELTNRLIRSQWLDSSSPNGGP